MTDNPKPLAGKVALITGATSGIGRALTLALALEGADLALASRNQDTLGNLGQEAAGLTDGQIMAQPTDVGRREQVEALADAVKNTFGHLDILVNNAGVGHAGTILDSNPDQVWEMIRTNLWGTYLVTRFCLPLMLGREGGDIVNISSVAGLKYAPGYAMYSATEFAVKAFSEALRNEVQSAGLRVLTVYPGMTESAFFQRMGAVGTPLPHQKRELLKPEQVSRGIVMALSHPPEVAVNELVIRPSWQER